MIVTARKKRWSNKKSVVWIFEKMCDELANG